MSPILSKVLWTVVIEGLKLYRRHYGGLTSEQQKELDKANNENFDRAGNMGSGVGE